jgi:ornithine cyclodeaminase/alanine dehydrogenase-like protein (mu-crystallin family)
VIVLDDAAVRRSLSPRSAVAAVREALAAHHTGRLSAPPRVRAPLDGGDLLVTAGRIIGGHYGFRVYDTLPTTGSDQVTVVFDDHTGQVVGVVTGTWLGAARTGAIGAVAVDLLAAPDASRVGLVGTGTQAWSQLWALRAVRTPREVRVFSRDPGRRADFAARCRAELDLPAEAVDSAREAVAEADVVVLATTSGTPVVEPDWVRPGAHVTTVGPKEVGRHECPVDLAARAGLLVTDSPAQLDGYAHPFFLDGTPARGRIVALSAVQAAEVTRPDAATLFCSVGLAGTEVAVATALFDTLGAGA